MILDLDRLTLRERESWKALEALLDRLEQRPDGSLSLEEATELRTLYHRACADLARVEHDAPEGELRVYLERLAGRAYAEIYSVRRHPWSVAWRRRWRLGEFARRLPVVFRRHLGMFGLALGITLAGCGFGALAVTLDPAGAELLLTADYLRQPAKRVAEAEHAPLVVPTQVQAEFSATLIANNIRVSILTFALGLTLGIGTGLLLFTNGLLLGAVVAQYTRLGFGMFAAGWLLPHGAFEIPSILLAGQAGFLLATCLLRGGREPRRERLRRTLPDLLTLVGGLSCLLVWAGLVEAFFSQRSAPAVPYPAKIAAGAAELILLTSYLFLVGRAPTEARPTEAKT